MSVYIIHSFLDLDAVKCCDIVYCLNLENSDGVAFVDLLSMGKSDIPSSVHEVPPPLSLELRTPQSWNVDLGFAFVEEVPYCNCVTQNSCTTREYPL